MKRRLFWGLLALLLLGPLSPALAACIVDDTGTRVCTDGSPRIVSLYGAYTEVLWEIGAGDRIVGRTRHDDTVPQLRGVPSVGTGLRPNVEYVLALRPGLVVARAGRAAARAVATLRERGLTVAAFDPRSIDDALGVMERLGVLTGRVAQARELAGRLRAEVDRVRTAVADAPRVRLVYEIRGQPLTVAGTDGLIHDIIVAAGGENAVRVPKKLLTLDVEALLRLDPEVYVIQEGPMNRNPPPLSERPLFRELRAVRAGRVLTVAEREFARPGPGLARAVRTLARFLHPDRVPDRAE
ncbi:ABC transporter substrate-binding protein [Deferrisoma camini]|uniref:ABC transporter substrate-binding protein n=1 Tax=Deferrisoma camini TaxID=1035120 RepID=UPI0004A2FCB9|nr:helical backbone metal receptor [Deferrisoma camini]